MFENKLSPGDEVIVQDYVGKTKTRGTVTKVGKIHVTVVFTTKTGSYTNKYNLASGYEAPCKRLGARLLGKAPPRKKRVK